MCPGRKPNEIHVCVFVCLTVVHLPKKNYPQAQKIIYNGHCGIIKGNIFISPITTKVIKKRSGLYQ